MKKVLWEELRRPEFDQAVADNAVVIIPTGSTEQHGVHLPVNTDSNIGFSIAKRAAEAADDFPILVLPSIWTGYSPMHMTRHGAITLKNNTLVDVLTQVAESVYTHGFKKVLFLNSHGGNFGPLAAMRMKLAYESHCPPCLIVMYFQLPSIPKVVPKVTAEHAGIIETSAQLYLQPELVDKESLYWTEGVFGDPSNGTREMGEQLIKTAANDLVKVCRDFRDGKRDDGWGWTEEVIVGRKDV
ncbi:MAG: creatininase family protein [Deltaproteobacteria bacterium]|nr:creatininase family protein [Deltaproteobacteria bacterium]